MKKNKIIGLLAITTMLAFPSFKSSQASLSAINVILSGMIEQQCSLTINDSSAQSFMIESSIVGVDKSLGTIKEDCNSSYAVTLSGVDGFLKLGGTDANKKIPYTLKYDNAAAAIGADTVFGTVVGSTGTSFARTVNNKEITINVTSVSSSLQAGTYSDTITFTMNAI